MNDDAYRTLHSQFIALQQIVELLLLAKFIEGGAAVESTFSRLLINADMTASDLDDHQAEYWADVVTKSRQHIDLVLKRVGEMARKK